MLNEVQRGRAHMSYDQYETHPIFKEKFELRSIARTARVSWTPSHRLEDYRDGPHFQEVSMHSIQHDT